MNDLVEVEVGAQTPGDRVRYWMALLDARCMGVECKNAGDDLQAHLKMRSEHAGIVVNASFTRQTMVRTPSLIRKSPTDLMLLAFVQEGTHVIRQGRQSAVLEGCGIYVLDPTRPFEVDFASDRVVQAAFHVPKAALTKRVGTLDDLAFGPETPLQKLVSSFGSGVARSLEEADGATLEALLNQTLDLFALMVGQRKERAIDPSTHRAGTLLRIKAYIEAHLRDETLTLERTARTLGISSRYLNALLSVEQTSFGRYVLARRLECARREIMDPRRAHKQVTEVAFDWGFRNTSHFGRTFKEKYGMTPRDAKFSEK